MDTRVLDLAAVVGENEIHCGNRRVRDVGVVVERDRKATRRQPDGLQCRPPHGFDRTRRNDDVGIPGRRFGAARPHDLDAKPSAHFGHVGILAPRINVVGLTPGKAGQRARERLKIPAPLQAASEDREHMGISARQIFSGKCGGCRGTVRGNPLRIHHCHGLAGRVLVEDI